MEGTQKKKNNKFGKSSLLIVGGILLVIVVGVVIANIIMKGSNSKSNYTKVVGGCKLVDDKCVAPCPSNCASCSNGKCSKCATGYYLSGNNCKKRIICNISNCTSCSADNKCSKCKSGYVLNNGECVTKTCSIPNCGICLDGICTRCNDGYKLENGNCVKASNASCVAANCKTCADNTLNKCSVCNDGYKLNSNGTCTKCSAINYCEEKDANCNCTKCKAGYYLNSNNKCAANCPSNCESCSNGNCTRCESNYVLYNDKCIEESKIKDCYYLNASANDVNYNYNENNKLDGANYEVQGKDCLIYKGKLTEEDCGSGGFWGGSILIGCAIYENRCQCMFRGY